MNWVLSLIEANSYLLEGKRAFETNIDSYLLSRDSGEVGGRCGCWGPDKDEGGCTTVRLEEAVLVFLSTAYG